MRQSVMNKSVVALLAIGIVVCCGFAWNLFERATELGPDVAVVEERGEALAQALDLTNDEANRSLDAIEAAAALQRQALDESAEESRRAMQAERDRASAQGARDRAERTTAVARANEATSERDAEEQRRQRREEWQRLGAALRKIAPTTGHEWRYSASLDALDVDVEGSLDRESRELLSRLAGVLLANYGYSASLAGSDSAAVRAYLVEVGVPQGALAVNSSRGSVVLELTNTVLD